MKVCLVTIAIGPAYFNKFINIFMLSQYNYSKKVGYAYRVIEESIGEIKTKELVSLEKQLICSQHWATEYDFIIFIDADILINPNSPPIHELCLNTDKIGVIDEWNQPTIEERVSLQIKNGWESDAKEYYSKSQLDLDTNSIYNTGVLVFQPKKHAEFCRNIYNKYKDRQLTHSRGYHYEQAVVNYEYQVNDMIYILPSNWNAVWGLHKLTTFKGTLEEFINKNYFVHLAGQVDYPEAEMWTKKMKTNKFLNV